MKTITIKRAIVCIMALFIFDSAGAQEDKKTVEINPAVDLVSSYVWRGAYQTGASIQPTLTFSYAGFSLTAWGSTDFTTSSDIYRSKEFDLALGYERGGLSIILNDYWWSGEGARYGRYSSDHYFEGMIGYHMGESFPLSLSWSTFFAGGDRDEKGNQQFSTYMEAAYDFTVKGVQVVPAIGISPWTGMYNKAGKSGFSVPSLSLTATKEIRFSESFSLPLFVQGVVSPENDDVFLVVGISF
ncbi:hypothetical protein D0T51_03315 [Parabacteroides sp. 52]|uniref:TorF family putative porin n=1 Tax=unclassified Parabacteroides TaxID=2649774 RepID=UPI0013D2A601|nr:MULTISPECIES: TorF family putative porin [unclassified Parabacteroides]MDH6534020.1 hypothetical protein [Parabacteroides sp. PM5-20]NDV54762.1 hypothetical protein [Parabacteroides sp. 52]